MKHIELEEIWTAAIDSVNGQRAVQTHLLEQNGRNNYGYLIAIGKAASAMSLGALEVLGNQIKRSLVITKYDHVEASLTNAMNIQIIEAGHPIADERSLLAGQAVLDFISTIPRDEGILFLISGGASSLVEVLPTDISLNQWQQLNQNLISSGKNIAEINNIRKSISMIKGGKLVAKLNGRSASALYISDVPGDELNLIGSGLLTPEQQNSANFSTEVKTVLHSIIANNFKACQSAAEHATKNDYPVYWHQTILEGDINNIAPKLAQALINGKTGIYIWGGETTVTLPDKPGKGGRNQALALLLARNISGQDNIEVLVAGTDGTDGPTDAAGGIINGHTISKGSALMMDATKHIQEANAYAYLQATKSLFKTGPTGTNVMDIIIAIKR